MDAADHRCPRCGAPFHCGAADAAPCECTTLRLDAELLAELARRYDGCLCLACLAELAAADARGERPVDRSGAGR